MGNRFGWISEKLILVGNGGEFWLVIRNKMAGLGLGFICSGLVYWLGVVDFRGDK
ncbi:MAG: hypothetical protein JW855_02890 [Gammaproteobacteria bacterium]|nr:hypothetical protein [Gammaproteobacteria bacterium]